MTIVTVTMTRTPDVPSRVVFSHCRSWIPLAMVDSLLNEAGRRRLLRYRPVSSKFGTLQKYRVIRNVEAGTRLTRWSV